MKIEQLFAILIHFLILCPNPAKSYEVTIEICNEHFTEELKNAMTDFFTELGEGGNNQIKINRKISIFYNKPKKILFTH
jgi:hypothetical protein